MQDNQQNHRRDQPARSPETLSKVQALATLFTGLQSRRQCIILSIIQDKERMRSTKSGGIQGTATAVIISEVKYVCL